jgi:hypothetical protein
MLLAALVFFILALAAYAATYVDKNARSQFPSAMKTEITDKLGSTNSLQMMVYNLKFLDYYNPDNAIYLDLKFSFIKAAKLVGIIKAVDPDDEETWMAVKVQKVLSDDKKTAMVEVSFDMRYIERIVGTTGSYTVYIVANKE